MAEGDVLRTSTHMSDQGLKSGFFFLLLFLFDILTVAKGLPLAFDLSRKSQCFPVRGFKLKAQGVANSRPMGTTSGKPEGRPT